MTVSAQKTPLELADGTRTDLERPLEAIVPAIVPEGETAEERALIAAQQCVNRIIKDKAISQTLIAMVTCRQLYAVAYREMQDNLAAYPEGTIPDMTEDVLMGSAMHHAALPFSEHTVMQSVVTTLLPWVADVIDRHTSADEEAEVEAKAARERERREKAIPLGFDPTTVPQEARIDPEEPVGVLPRDRGLILVGWHPALLWLIDRILQGVLEAQLVTVRLSDVARRAEASSRMIRLGGGHWYGCCNTKAGIPRLILDSITTKVSGSIDLLVCDNMVKAYTKSYIGRADGATAGDAHKRFAEFAKGVGCGFIGLVPRQEQDVVNITGPEFEQLRTFARVLAVNVTRGPETYTVRVATLCVSVPHAELDAFAPQIILQA